MNSNQNPLSSGSGNDDSKVKERKVNSSNLKKSSSTTNLIKMIRATTTDTDSTTTTTASTATITNTNTNTSTCTISATILENYENSIMKRACKSLNNCFDPMSLGIYNTGPYSFSTLKNSIAKMNLTQTTPLRSLLSQNNHNTSLFNDLYSNITNLIQEYENKVGNGEDLERRLRLKRVLETNNSSLIASVSESRRGHQYEYDQDQNDRDFKHYSVQRDIRLGHNLVNPDGSNFEQMQIQYDSDGQIFDGNGNNTIYKPLNFHWPVLDVIQEQEEVESEIRYHGQIENSQKCRKLFKTKYRKYPIGRVHNPVLDVIYEQEDEYGHEKNQNLVENTSSCTSSVSTTNSVDIHASETFLEYQQDQDIEISSEIQEPELLNAQSRILYGDYQTEVEFVSILKQIEEEPPSSASVDPFSVIQTISRDFFFSNELGLNDFLKQEIKSNTETEKTEIRDSEIPTKLHGSELLCEQSRIYDFQTGTTTGTSEIASILEQIEEEQEPSSSVNPTISQDYFCLREIGLGDFLKQGIKSCEIESDQIVFKSEDKYESILESSFQDIICSNGKGDPDTDTLIKSSLENHNEKSLELVKSDSECSIVSNSISSTSTISISESCYQDINIESEIFSKDSLENLELSPDQDQEQEQILDKSEDFSISSYEQPQVSNNADSEVLLSIDDCSIQIQNLFAKQDQIFDSFYFNSKDIILNSNEESPKIDKEHVERYIQEYKSRISDNLATFRKNPLDHDQSNEPADVTSYLFCDSPNFSQCSLKSQPVKVEQIFLSESGESFKKSKRSNAQNHPEFRVISLDQSESNYTSSSTSSISDPSPKVKETSSKIDEIDEEAKFLPHHVNERNVKSPPREKKGFKAHIVTKPRPNQPSTNIITLRMDSKPKSQEELRQYIQKRSFDIIRSMVTYLILTCPTPISKPKPKSDSNHRKHKPSRS